MFKIIMFILALLALGALNHMSGSEDRVEHARYAAQRLESQDLILSSLVALNDVHVSQFVMDWVAAYPQPTPENLTELRLIEQAIKNDKSVAIQMTKAYKVENNPVCNGDIQTVFSKTPDCPPGL